MEIILDELDEKLLENFRGYVVKKDLVQMLKVGENVPVFVLEYLIANSCSTRDGDAIKRGMDNVKMILSDHYVNPEESSLIHSRIRDTGSYKIIDKVSVLLDSKKDKYWAHLLNSNIKDANISDALVGEHEKLMLGGVWAVIDMEYDPEIKFGSNIYPFVVSEIKPIQLSNFETVNLLEAGKITQKKSGLIFFLEVQELSQPPKVLLTGLKCFLFRVSYHLLKQILILLRSDQDQLENPMFLRSSPLIQYLFQADRERLRNYLCMVQLVKLAL